MAGDPAHVSFRRHEFDAVLPYMARLDEAHAGWINFEAAIHVEDAPPPASGLFGTLFTSRGPDVPLVTWAPGELRKGGAVGRATVGILHPSGPGAAKRVDIPTGWVKLQDHSKKGLVLAVAAGTPHAELLDWVLGAAITLSVIPLTGEWRASIYAP